MAIQCGACMVTVVAGCNGTLDRHGLAGLAMTAKTTTSLRGGGADAAIQYGACMGTAVASGTLDRHAPSALAMTAKGNTLDRHGLSGLAMTAKD